VAEIKSFKDGEGNTYRVERASNGKFVVMRYNEGGNRKLFKQIPPSKSKAHITEDLRFFGAEKGWTEQ